MLIHHLYFCLFRLKLYLLKYLNGGSSIKVLGLVGSPNIKGNTAKLVNAILDGAAENGADKVVYNLASLDIRGCDACRRCLDSGCCLIDDDMQEIYQEIQTADIVVLGSPVYMWQMTAQTKLFVDRLTAFLRPNFSSRLDHKKLILVFSQGSSDRDAFKPYFEYTAGLLYYLGFDVLDTIIAAGTDKLEVSFRPYLLEKAKDLGKLVSALNLPGPECTRIESTLTQSL
ncbi:MAG: flavodoxin family protein [Alphaproteobacteria bacterium]|nr:MAG: flavodoxin family protein [Alphaproteobacteria bacterium]